MTNNTAAATVDHKTLFALWEEFRDLFTSRGVDPSTIELIRHGFYAGAAANFLLVLDGDAGETKEQAEARIERLNDELKGFRFDIALPRRGGSR